MNIQALREHQRMLAIFLGVAVVATIGGSVAYAQTSGSSQTPIQGSINVPQMVLSSVKVNFADAANTAAKQVSNSQVLAGALTVKQGSLVYAFKVTNGTSLFSVIVDAGTGQALMTSQGHPFYSIGSFGGMGGHGFRGHGFAMHKGEWAGPQSQGGAPPTTTNPSGFQE